MEPSDVNNPVWKRLVLDKIQVNLNFLAAKIMLSRLQILVKRNDSLDILEGAKKEIFELYFKNKDLPSVKKDISLLLNK
jgi:hypothetical protein